MMNKKVENCIIIVLWLVLIVLLRQIFPGSPKDMRLKMQYICLSTILMIILYYFYARIRNRVIYKRILFIKQNGIEEALGYIEKCIKNYPSLLWIKICKLTTLAEDGRVIDFKAYKEIILKGKKVLKRHSIEINAYSSIFNYMESIEFALDDSSSKLKEFNWVNDLLSSLNKCENTDTIIKKALCCLNSDKKLFRSFASVVLTECYLNKKNNISAKLYETSALNNAPSDEFAELIKKRFYYIEKNEIRGKNEQ